jgi:hypothetical protein
MSTGVLTQDVLSVSGQVLRFSANSPALVSLYDPFSNYTITTDDNTFSIEQITNGSFYFGKEQDGTISIYSIDAVGRLNFLDRGTRMTDMVVFPGMYIRFDPTLNAGLKSADLFRILLSMGPSGTDKNQDVQNNQVVTGVEFVNLRMDDSNDRDTFFMYRLPKNTKVLFKMLHILFHDRVAQIDILKKYASSSTYTSPEDLSAWVKNPSKRNYFLFRELEKVLSDAIQFPTQKEEFSKKIRDIHIQAQSFMVGNTINTTLEQFLTDSRFALFSANGSNKKYEDIYNEVATILGINKTTGKYQFFQKLSDIYSQNIVVQRKESAFSKIDTYTPTASELLKSLNSPDIEQKDYFDIALYAFNVLKKAEDR